MTPQQREQQTELLPTVPPAIPDPFPPSWPTTGRRAVRDRSGAAVGLVVRVAALATLLGIVFVAGQLTARTGAVPPPPLTRVAAEVTTEAQMARVWPAMAAPDQATVCRSWVDGTWREYVTDRWVTHLQSPAGGGIDVDRATVAGFIGRVCARGG